MSAKPRTNSAIPGMPEHLITDNGKAFQSLAFSRLIKQLTEPKANEQ